MSSPANRTALRAEENRPAPPSQQVSARAVTGAHPVQPLPQRLRAGQVAGRACQLPAQGIQLGLGHLQRPQVQARPPAAAGDSCRRRSSRSGASPGGPGPAPRASRVAPCVEQHRARRWTHAGVARAAADEQQLQQHRHFQDVLQRHQRREKTLRQAGTRRRASSRPVGLRRCRPRAARGVGRSAACACAPAPASHGQRTAARCTPRTLNATSGTRFEPFQRGPQMLAGRRAGSDLQTTSLVARSIVEVIRFADIDPAHDSDQQSTSATDCHTTWRAVRAGPISRLRRCSSAASPAAAMPPAASSSQRRT